MTKGWKPRRRYEAGVMVYLLKDGKYVQDYWSVNREVTKETADELEVIIEAKSIGDIEN